MRKGLWGLVKSGLFFAPRRHVAIDVVQSDDLPRTADRVALNRYLEDFYNRNAGGSTYVPYSLWEGGGVRWLPEPVGGVGQELLQVHVFRHEPLDHRNLVGVMRLGFHGHVVDLGRDQVGIFARGNHGQSIAFAAQRHGVPATIFVSQPRPA